MILALVPAHARILAVGVEGDGGYSAGCSDTGNQIERGLLRGGSDLTAVAYLAAPLSLRAEGATLMRADGKLLPFVDGSFDVVISNAVVEHIGGPGEARRFLAESQRVARTLVIHTTPNRWFPIETHTRLPLLHWLPRRLHPKLFGQNSNYRWGHGDWLFSGRELVALSPGGRLIGGWPRWWPMSLVAAWPSPPTRASPADPASVAIGGGAGAGAPPGHRAPAEARVQPSSDSATGEGSGADR